MNIRRQHHGVQKICHCGRSRWPRCSHAWYLRFKTRRGPRWQLSLDAELGRHIGSKTEAEAEAARIRAAILAGTFERAADRLERELRQAACGPATSAGIALDAFAKTYVERASKTSGKVSWAKDGGMFDRVCAYRSTDARALGQWPLSSITEDAIEAFFASLSDLAASTRNKYVQLLKASFRWAAKKGYLARSPISEDSALKRTKTGAAETPSLTGGRKGASRGGRSRTNGVDSLETRRGDAFAMVDHCSD